MFAVVTLPDHIAALPPAAKRRAVARALRALDAAGIGLAAVPFRTPGQIVLEGDSRYYAGAAGEAAVRRLALEALR